MIGNRFCQMTYCFVLMNWITGPNQKLYTRVSKFQKKKSLCFKKQQQQQNQQQYRQHYTVYFMSVGIWKKKN